MVMVPPISENYVVLDKGDWTSMSEIDSQIFNLICEEEGEPYGQPDLNEDGTYQVRIMDHDTGEDRVVWFGEGRDEVHGCTTDDVKVPPVTSLKSSDHDRARGRAKQINKGVRAKVFGNG